MFANRHIYMISSMPSLAAGMIGMLMRMHR